MTEVSDVAKADGVVFNIPGEKACVAKLRAACRNAMPWAPHPGSLRGVVPDPALGLGEGIEKTIKGLVEAPLLGIV